ncbi:MscL family protein [Streptomyces sp. NPDC005486]|uniref:MscL family protein n=1 Tax=Streptomyces sp. NPDC005486 TaxID=3155345 RepID=UPI0033BBCEC2
MSGEKSKNSFKIAKEFVLRRNIVELTAAVAIGIALSQLINAIVEGVVIPLLAGEGMTTPWRTILGYGITAPITVLGVYVVVVRPLNRRHERVSLDRS